VTPALDGLQNLYLERTSGDCADRQLIVEVGEAPAAADAGTPARAAIGFRVRDGVRDSIHYIGAVR
jgi:hypothetical protein